VADLGEELLVIFRREVIAQQADRRQVQLSLLDEAELAKT